MSLTPQQRQLMKRIPKRGYVHRSELGATDEQLRRLCLKGLIEEHPQAAWTFKRKVAA